MSVPPDNGQHRQANDPAGRGEHQRPEPSLSDLLRGGSSSSRRTTSPADLVAQLGKIGEPLNTDDSPTIITSVKPVPAPAEAVTDAPTIVGRKLGHFELIEAVGSGGMAAVLKARDLDLGRIVALKILPPESTQDAENVTRFKSEARAAAKLDHENVARVYFCGEDQGLHFIAFEFVEGETLRARIDKRGTLPAGECVRYMIQVAAGLNHAAERGVVHRDIKPSNIIITPDGRAKIVDMGLARHLDAGSGHGGVTQSGVTLGTFDYISPEQALDPRRADVRSDIYSLGCTFYHALTGRPPVPEGTAAKKLRAHQQIPPLDPRVLNPAIPDELAAVLGRMMVKDQDKRYQTPAELIAHLKGVAEKLHLSTDSVSTDSVVRAVAADPRVLPEPPKIRAAWVVAAVAVTIAVTVFLATQGGQKATPPPPWADSGKKDDGNGGAPFTPGGTAAVGLPQPGADGFVRVRTAEELAKALADSSITKVRLDARNYDLTKLASPVVFKGKELELVGFAPSPVRVKVFVGADLAAGTLSLTAEESLRVTNVRFEVMNQPDDADPDTIGIQLTAPEVRLTDCVIAPESKLQQNSAVVVVAGNSAEAVRVRLERCLFARGVTGLQVPAKSDVTIDDCGFGSHVSAIWVKSGETMPATVRLTRSSFVLEGYSAAVDAESPVRVTAGYCVFAADTGATAIPNFTQLPPDRGAVVRERGEKLAADTFAGVPDQKNAYYRVNPI
ncbi:MAG TPA: serine/threonine-protein kinase, partial [Gemmataceae bacterium]|nr:serine/threonine-protein kinase [Gemmataceae bacterium]